MEPMRVELRGSRYSAVSPETKSCDAPAAGHLEHKSVRSRAALKAGEQASGASATDLKAPLHVYLFPQPPMTSTGGAPTRRPTDESSLPQVAASVPPGLPPPPGMPSHGSALHNVGGCRPCAWFWKDGGCQNGLDCRHCHLCLPGAVRESKRTKRSLKARAAAELRQMQQAKVGTQTITPLQLRPEVMLTQHPPFAPYLALAVMGLPCLQQIEFGYQFGSVEVPVSPRKRLLSSSSIGSGIGSSSDSLGPSDGGDSSEESDDCTH